MSLYDDVENTAPENEEANTENNEEITNTEVTEEVQNSSDVEDIVDDSNPVLDDTKLEQPTETQDFDNEIPKPDEVPEVIDAVTKKKSVAPIVALIVIIAAIIIGLVVYICTKNSNPYNKLGYVNPSGKTVADIAVEMDVSVEEFLAQWDLPEDMPADTTEMAAYYSMPFKSIASMYGTDIDTLKEQLQIPDEAIPAKPRTFKEKILSIFGVSKPVPIDEDTPWGIVEDELTISNYYGENNVEDFKEYYGFGDEVTADTKIKEIRSEINKKTLEMMAEQEAEEQANIEDSVPQDETASEETSEPVDNAESESAEDSQDTSSQAE